MEIPEVVIAEIPNSVDGLVQREVSEGLEGHIPSNRDNCKRRRTSFVRPNVDRGEESVVVVFNRCTFA